ncbi:glycosyltransferase family 22 protein [Amorphotheca resinae ATCC 22711]|uniref:Mannosyltransferase n=1 Tax=Amorphotheca resinae ATCC 22711 TaxID=857342 RepID=A0A2T3B0N1_AMORE|nr:glycosyltransferase family 22 protein [Amorphotheca resinae ATCC 22711]PSS16965.1 glycosyltransferase family 22 protein [Amorphotheca resinae ATCC 22711]
MKAPDLILYLLIPTLILIHLLVAPYTKVEESFNIQATHDIIHHQPFSGIQNFDHVSFPGAVPRTFVGALLLAALSKPILLLTGSEDSIQHAQVIVRAVLGLLNAAALLRYKTGLDKAFGKNVGRWYILLQASQFHVIYYASRTLPNMFAFALTTLALREFLPITGERRQSNLGIFLLVLAGVIFRSEIALLLFTQLAFLLVQSRVSLQSIIPTGLISALVALAISIPVDSYFWQRPIWPELAGFYYNAIQGKSADWGTSPYIYYFSSLLPRLLLNPLILIALIPLSLIIPATRFQSRDLVVPSVLFIAIYSLQPHKESRFIIYVVPALTAAASLSASYIWTRRSKSILYSFGALFLAASITSSFAGSTAMLLISSLNYPGGEALSRLHNFLAQDPSSIPTINGTGLVKIHMDVLSCMTGITRFQQYSSFGLNSEDSLALGRGQLPEISGIRTHLVYDKTEEGDELLDPQWWSNFDFALMEEPGKAIGAWEVISTVYAYAGIEVLRPGQRGVGEILETTYEANNLTKETPDSAEVRSRVEELKGSNLLTQEIRSLNVLKNKFLKGELSRYEIYLLLKGEVRLFTGGWWVGPRMVPRISILRRIKDSLP